MGKPIIVLATNTAWSVLKFRSGLVNGLQKEGYRVIALVPEDGYSSALPCEYSCIRVDRSGTNPLRDLRLLYALRERYRALKPVAALHFTSKLNIYGSMAAHEQGIPSIANITGLGSGFLGGGAVAWIQKKMYRLALRRAEKVFFQNADDFELFSRLRLVDRSRSALIPGSGIDLTAFLPCRPPAQDRFVFLLIARLLQDKGIFEYVEAARRMKALTSSVEFRLVGFLDEHNPSGIAATQIERWDAEKLIIYRGPREDVREEIAQADCIVLPSYREGTPRTLLEAAAMGRPIITTDTPGCRQVVEDGVNGFLCRVRDGMDLTEKMLRMMTLTKDDRRKMGENGRKKMEREYDEAIVIRAYLDALKDLEL